MAKGYMYILLCANNTYYTGSTKYLELRVDQHNNGEGANYTTKHSPVKLIYYEEYPRIDYHSIEKSRCKVGAVQKKKRS